MAQEADDRKTMEEINRELMLLKLKVTEQEEALAIRNKKPLIFATGRQLARFKDKPEKPSDLYLEEWIADVKCSAESRQLSEAEYAGLLCENLGGRARQEITARGDVVCKSPEKIIKILRKVFGDCGDLPRAQHKFYAYRQTGDKDLVTCSLDLIDLYDKIVEINDTFSGMRDLALKGQLAEAAVSDVQQREIRRLTKEQPDLSFLDLRDQVIERVGNGVCNKVQGKSTHVNEHRVDTEDIIKRQEYMIAQQQKQINDLLQALHAAPKPDYSRTPLTCWSCGKVGHVKRRCPENQSKPNLNA